MLTRRDMNSAFALTALFSGAPVAVLRAQTAPESASPHGHMAGMSAVAVKTLMQEPLGEIANPEVTVITLTVAPGAMSPPHKHIGPVFAYILEGKIENQVDPEAPKKLMPRLQQLFNRAQPTPEEIHILRGIAKAMSDATKPPRGSLPE